MPSAIAIIRKWAASIIGPAAGDPRTAASVRTPLGQLGDRTLWLKYLLDLIWGPELAIVGRSGNVLEITAHALPSNTAVRVFATSAGTLPAPLAADTVYYVRVVDADHIELSATSGPGAAITLTADGSGDQWLATIPDWISGVLVTNATYGSGKLKDLVVWLSGPQTVTGAKTFADFTISGTALAKLASRARTRILDGIVDHEGAAKFLSVLTEIGVDEFVAIPIRAPHGAIVTGFRVWVDPAAHAALPGTMPHVALHAVDVDGDVTILDDKIDPSADFTAYSAKHAIEKTGVSYTLDRSLYKYKLHFVQESGADSAAGYLLGASIDFTTAAYDDGAG